MRSRLVIPVMLFVMMLTLPASGEGDPTRDDASAGLPQGTDSFSTVEVFDSDSDGRDEIYLGGAGFRDGDIRTEGIRAYEYGDSGWVPFGSGLPEEGSGLYYGALGLGDVNGDAMMDIAAPIPNRWYAIDQTGIDLYAGDGSGNFALLHRIPLESGNPGSSNEAEIADMDGDGDNDVIVSTYTGVNVFFGDGSGTNWVEKSPPHVKNTEISGIGIGDLDKDGLLDIVGTPYQRSTDVEMYVQESRRTWRDVPFKDVSVGFGTKVLDLNADGNADVVYGSLGDGIKVWLGEGTVSRTEFPCTEADSGLPTQDTWDQIEFGDVNGDDLPDMVAASASGSVAHLFVNGLPSGWTEVFTGDEALFVGGDNYGANFGDWNGDGTLDVAGCGWDDGANAWIVSAASGGNRPPVADAGDDRTANVGAAVSLDGSGSRDPDGSISAWEWSCASTPVVSITDNDKMRASFTAPESGPVRITLKVQDDSGEWSPPDEIRITVIDPNVNQKPIADAGKPITGSVGKTITLDGSSSRDLDGSIAAYAWTAVGKTVTINDADRAEASFTPVEEGDYTFSLVVTDDDGARSDPDTVVAHIASSVFYPRIGPFLYESGSPVKGAIATLTAGTSEYSAETDDDGYASFENGVPSGSYECSLHKDGKTLLDPFGITVKDTGAVSVDGGSIPKVKEAPSKGSSWILIGIAVGAVLLFGMMGILFLLIRKKPEESATSIRAEPSTEYSCDRCGGKLTYNSDFNRFYCNGCREYK